MLKCSRCDGKGWLRSDEMECAETDVSDCDACHGSGRREDQLSHLIRSNQIYHQRKSQEETKELVEELIRIESAKPPKPVVLDDGRVMVWNGPDLSTL